MKRVNAIPKNAQTISNDILDLKLFKLVRGDHDSNHDEASVLSSMESQENRSNGSILIKAKDEGGHNTIRKKSSIKNNQMNENQMYSLRDILNQNQSLISDFMFQIESEDISSNDNNEKFRYVHLKKKYIQMIGDKNDSEQSRKENILV